MTVIIKPVTDDIELKFGIIINRRNFGTISSDGKTFVFKI